MLVESVGRLARPPIFGDFEFSVGEVFLTSGTSTSTDESVFSVSRIGLSGAGQGLSEEEPERAENLVSARLCTE